MISIDSVSHVHCPTCGATPGESCKATKSATEAFLRAVAGNPKTRLRITLQIDHDGATEAHLARIRRADGLADATLSNWRRDELLALVLPFADNGAFFREGRKVD